MLNATLRRQLDALRAGLDARRVPGGIALTWGTVALPDGSADAPATGQAAWQVHYGFLATANALAGQVPPLHDMTAALAGRRADDPVPVAVACYDTAVLQAQVRARVVAAAQAGTGLDPLPDDPHGLLEPRLAAMACCPLHDQWDRATPVYRGRVVRFVLDRAFWFTGYSRRLPDEVELDPGDGRAPRRLRFGEELTCIYPPGGGERTITVRFTSGGDTVVARAVLGQVDEPAPPEPDARWPLSAGGTPAATAWLYRNALARESRSLVLLVEGFPGGYAPGYLYEMFDQHGMVASWRAAGYDVAMLGFANGLRAMQSNAQAVTAAIAEARERGYRDLVVGAVSMGGLVARYALAELEAAQVPHGARVFFTIDTPHRGAYTSLAIQWFVHFFADAIPSMASFKALLDCPANQQFVALWVHDGEVIESPLRRAFMARLARLGNYPTGPTRLALACGRGDGQRGIAAGATLVEWRGGEFAGATLSALGAAPDTATVLGEGHCYLAAADVPGQFLGRAAASYEGVPGGYNVYPAVAAAGARSLGCGDIVNPHPVCTSIPTVSALDIDADPDAPVPAPGGGDSPFDDYLCAERDMPHVKITAPMSTWLLRHVGAPAPATEHTE